eukprot:TRINITY_DN15118_c0_g1_i1.p1 TRINITY_DN15118_c0_g1~~TRINITY_DN15118_c0_g1_i1.p1  ORF type:complete len:455 (+),score=82.65 TRINITY_DN15118_c0_g1_i1:120-1367(+)
MLLLQVRAETAVVPATGNAYPSFQEYLKLFNKTYNSSEMKARELLYLERLAEIKSLNARAFALWTAGVNRFTDATPEERQLRRRPRAGRRLEDASGTNVSAAVRHLGSSLPQSKNWRWATGSIRSEWDCGSCWANTAISAIQGHLAIATGVHLELSTQQLVDCAVKHGCQGGTEEEAFAYAEKAGLADDQSYPYSSAHNGGHEGNCKMGRDGPQPVAGITGYHALQSNDELALLTALAHTGPVVVGVDASEHWDFYKGGIFDSCNKHVHDVDHDVLLIGYGEENGVKYWLIQNGWADDWGERGLMKIRRHSRPTDCASEKGDMSFTACGTCGILSNPLYPTGAFLTGSSESTKHGHHQPDKHQSHSEGSCTVYGCGTHNSHQSCQCNHFCAKFNDCCPDYWAQCKPRRLSDILLV